MAVLVPDEKEIVVQKINILFDRTKISGTVFSPFGALWAPLDTGNYRAFQGRVLVRRSTYIKLLNPEGWAKGTLAMDSRVGEELQRLCINVTPPVVKIYFSKGQGTCISSKIDSGHPRA